MLWVCTVAQSLFVVVWLTQRWWVTRVGRALMAKSAALAVIFAASLWAFYRGPLPVWLGRSIFGAVTLAIVLQFVALAYEVWRARVEHRPVSGANGNHHQH